MTDGMLLTVGLILLAACVPFLRTEPVSGKDRFVFPYPAGRGYGCRSASGDASGGDVVAVPVVDGKGFDAHAGTGLGTVHEVVLTDVDAGMVAGTGNAENDDVAGTEAAARDALTGICLVPADARNADAVAGAGPVDESGTVEALGRGRTAEDVRTAELTFCRGGNGCAAAAGDAGLRSVVGGSVGLFSAACGHEHGCAQNQKGEDAEKRTGAKCRHGCPAGFEQIPV